MKITFGQKLGNPSCPYLQRWVLQFGTFSLRLHRWLGSDDQRNHHDHPWWFFSFVLWGGYDDISPTGIDRLGPGSVVFRPATHRHTVRVRAGGCWSFLLTGPEERIWGFWVQDRFRKRNRYFFDWGNHPCERIQR